MYKPSILPHTHTVFRPGDEGLYWYAVISGSLDILDSDPSDSSKVDTAVTP